MRRLIAGLTAAALTASLAGAAVAQAVHAPAAGSAERRALMDAVRPVVQAKVGGSVEFVVNHIAVGGDHAFVMLEPQRPGGGAIDYRGEDAEFMDGLHTEALLARRGGRWVVEDHAIGSTDAWYLSLCDRYARLVPTC
jgi:hypothetical protein